MKHLAVTASHNFDQRPVSPQETGAFEDSPIPHHCRSIFETDDGRCYDNLSGETLDRETVKQLVEQLRKYADNLDDYLLRTCGAHATLVYLCQHGFPEPDCGGGWHFANEPECSLSQQTYGDKPWLLSVECTYEHDDDRGGQYTQNEVFLVENGRLLVFGGEDLADANDREACGEALRDYFDSEGPC